MATLLVNTVEVIHVIVIYIFFRIDISEDQTSIIKLGVAAMANALRFLIVWPQEGPIMRNVPRTLKRTRSFKNRQYMQLSTVQRFLSNALQFAGM